MPNTVSSLLSPGVSIALGFLALAGACTSTSSPTIEATDSGAEGGTPPKDGGGTDAKATTDAKPTGTDSSTDEDTGTPDEDAGPIVCTAISGGLACDPGHIYCGGANCDAATQDCCVDLSGSTAVPTCGAKGSCGSKVAMSCDEKDDCGAGEICCFTAAGVKPTGSQCQSTPCTIGGQPSQFAQSCRGPDECDSGVCVKGSCKGYEVETCSTFPSAACQ